MPSVTSVLKQYRQLLDEKADMPVSRLLALLFTLRGKPLTLEWSHFFFEPIFRLQEIPRIMTLKCGRQIGKSQSQAAAQILHSFLVPYFTTLTVLPRFEQARIFSQTVVGPLLKESPFRGLIVPPQGTDSVLQRDIGRGSKLLYGYSFGGADRLRGRATDANLYDEVQSMDTDEIDIINQCMSASPFKITRLTGTPLTYDNVIQKYWDNSSQAEWIVPCSATGCKHNNICSVEADLLKMIGDKTLICAVCGQPVNARIGFWCHSYPERQRIYAGYHIPQCILPMHYEDPKAWRVILDNRRLMPAYKFHNEVLGESFDNGAKLITRDEVLRACTIEKMEPQSFLRGKYISVVVGVDWGGRGKEKATDTDDFISNTVITINGLTPEGVVEVPFIYRVPYSVDMHGECELVAQIAGMIHADFVAMDYGGQGNVLEEMVISAGWPRERIVPFTYATMTNNRPIIHYKPPKAFGVRSSYILDKPRSLLLLCQLVKHEKILFANDDDYKNGPLTDFQSIFEEAVENPRGPMLRLVKRLSGRTDDTVHSINFGVMALFHSTRMWPELAKLFINSGGGTEDDGMDA